jgi:hypothetical protein
MQFRIVILLFSFIAITIHGCIAHGPKYSRVEKVLQLRPGMSKGEAEKILGVRPYDLKSMDSLGTRTLIYKYRVTERRTLPFLLKDTNGQEIRGKFVDLHITYNSEDTLVSMFSKKTDSEIREKRVDINTLINFITVTAPAVLIYLGITQP